MQYHIVESRMTPQYILVELLDGPSRFIKEGEGITLSGVSRKNFINKGFRRKLSNDMSLRRMTQSSPTTMPKYYQRICSFSNLNTRLPNIA
jgi:hypothetical protein